jgi:high-affinity iron transporter
MTDMNFTVAIEAGTILVREGLEAILVLAALAAYLTKSGAESRLSALYTGAGLAVAASIGAAWVFEQYFGGTHNDYIEGVVILLSAALMFYVSGWLFVRQDPKNWSAFLKSQTDKIASDGTLMAVGVLSFLAVFREGAETVLFLHGLAKTNGGWTLGLVSGIVGAAVLLIALFVIILRTTRHLPLRPVFLLSSAFLFLMGLKFVGAGLQEFQEQALIPFDVSPAADMLLWLGLNPSWEALLAQAVILALAAVTFVWARMERQSAAG